MGFRRGKSREHERREAWAAWVALHRPELQAIGLPPEVHLSADHWEDFLENGHLERHPQDCTGFAFDRLTPASAGALRRLLEGEHGEEDPCPPLLGWLRVRHEQGRVA
jgi:hypothetical protein